MQIFSLAVIAVTAAPQGFRQTDVLEFEEPQNLPARNPSGDLVSAVLKALSTQRSGSSSRRQSEGNLVARRPSGAEGGGGGILRLILALVAEELGLSGLEGRLDGVDQEAIIRNVIKAIQTVGSVLLA